MVLDALGEHDAAVWLFGSCARGEVFQHSDIDIAILPRDELPSAFFAMLAADIEKSTIPYDVDLVDLREAGPSFREEVLRTGIKWRERLIPFVPVRAKSGGVRNRKPQKYAVRCECGIYI
ncbi:MAG: type VII toxin-antitoxin system MntA family adenylyltransferase antitoxin [Stellaceae bacterium]